MGIPDSYKSAVEPVLKAANLELDAAVVEFLADHVAAGIPPDLTAAAVQRWIDDTSRRFEMLATAGHLDDRAPGRRALEEFESEHGSILVDNTHPKHALLRRQHQDLLAAVAVETERAGATAAVSDAARAAARETLAEREKDPAWRHAVVHTSDPQHEEATAEYAELARLAAGPGDPPEPAPAEGAAS